MNDKTKNSMKTIVKYIRDFSIVVAGIAVTLYVNYQVTNQGEKRDLKLYLNAIKMELEDNIMYINGFSFERESEYAGFLKSHEKDKLDFAVIEDYARGSYADVDLVFFRTSAFEMFKSSGTMRLLQNKELMQKIWDTYFWLNRHEVAFEKLTQIKMDEVKKWLEERGKYPDKKIIPLYIFYVGGAYDDYLERCTEMYKDLSIMLNKTVSELRKELNN